MNWIIKIYKDKRLVATSHLKDFSEIRAYQIASRFVNLVLPDCDDWTMTKIERTKSITHG
jgi:hypothetical protein